ncbi:hypothetical protein BN12_4060018 [Nostocoides japonicum T1-X7]|uniref:Transposase IS66 zinc-finger binding domain-containing protein n=1 Tax=Nostocoides japonicum T1-X7 TaxID=1194083 RepID=A0A077LZ87_9MICO|nr:hypothetical protein BN12_4060018 [Tetrasphaera japonica T1-X7]
MLRQVFDLPQMAVEVTEHQMLSVACGCGHATRAAAPARVAGPTSGAGPPRSRCTCPRRRWSRSNG